MYGGRTAADVMVGEKKRPERPASVPYRSFEALRPGRGADPRYPLGPPLMLSPVALPGTGALDGISDPFPLTVPSGREEIYLARRRGDNPLLHGPRAKSSTNAARFSTGRRQQEKSRGSGAGRSLPQTQAPREWRAI